MLSVTNKLIMLSVIMLKVVSSYTQAGSEDLLKNVTLKWKWVIVTSVLTYNIAAWITNSKSYIVYVPGSIDKYTMTSLQVSNNSLLYSCDTPHTFS